MKGIRGLTYWQLQLWYLVRFVQLWRQKVMIRTFRGAGTIFLVGVAISVTSLKY